MRPGIRFGLSAIEKRDVWSRWKAGESLHEIGRAFDKPHSCIRAVLLPRDGHSPSRSERTSPEGSVRVARFGRSREVWIERPAPCAGRSLAMVVVRPIELMRQITKLGLRPCG